MNFNKHYDLKDKHAFLSPSQSSWLNYDDDRLVQAWDRRQATLRGTLLHEMAANDITQNMPRPDDGTTYNSYVNDAIRFRMTAELPLVYSDICFGTADAICFYKNVLRIHDLKTGIKPAKPAQLEVYAALFCLEYDVNPNSIKIILRLYQNDEITEWEPDPTTIIDIMADIMHKNKLLHSYMIGE